MHKEMTPERRKLKAFWREVDALTLKIENKVSK